MMKKMFHRENNLSNLNNQCKEYSLMVNQLFLTPKLRISSFFFRSFQRWNIHTAIFNNRHAWEKIVNDQIDPFRRTLVQFRAEEAD